MDDSRETPRLITGGLSVDDRGQISFVNEFSFSAVQRFYLVENFSTEIIRAFHGHRREAKYALAVSGSALVAVAPLGDGPQPDQQAPVGRYTLSARQPALLYIPAGYANGFRALEPRTSILFLSTATLEESRADDLRLPYDYWGKQVWEIEHR